jgi:hypothetical protein
MIASDDRNNGVTAMDGSPDGTPPPTKVRYSATAWQRTTPLLPLAVLNAALIITSLTGTPPPDAVTALLTLWVGLVLLGTLLPSCFGLTLTPSAAVVRNLRRRTIPWPDIQAIQVEPIMGIRSIVLYEANGRRTQLRAPTTGFLAWDRHFERKFHAIETWWLTHRGPDWTPIPPPPAWWNTQPPLEHDPFAPPR